MIASQYNEEVHVERMALVEDTNKKEFVQHITLLSCAIQPLTGETTQDIPGGFGKDFLMFCDPVDIKEGDRIIRDADESGGGREYRVMSVETFNFLRQSHMEVTIRIFE